jgi:hypothetical protein
LQVEVGKKKMFMHLFTGLVENAHAHWLQIDLVQNENASLPTTRKQNEIEVWFKMNALEVK